MKVLIMGIMFGEDDKENNKGVIVGNSNNPYQQKLLKNGDKER